MKISNLNLLNFNNIYKQVSFNGINRNKDSCIFVYDLDGTLANGTNEQIYKVLEISKARNAKVTYATGRGLQEFYILQNELLSKGCKLDSPDFLIANNGENIYTNSDGKLLKNYEYSRFLKESTNFNKIYISKKVSSVNNGLDEIESNSMMLKYNVPEHINIKALRKNILDTFSKEKIKVLCGYKGEGTNNQTLYIAPFNKAMAINYLKQYINIPYNEILIAGNDNNDISMAKLSQKGSKFICLNNSKPNLMKVCEKLSKENKNIFFSLSPGAKGIIEGLLKFLS